MFERTGVRGKTIHATLYFQVRSQPRLAYVLRRPRRPEIAGAIPSVARGRRRARGCQAAEQSQPRRDRGLDRQRRLSALEVEERQEAVSDGQPSLPSRRGFETNLAVAAARRVVPGVRGAGGCRHGRKQKRRTGERDAQHTRIVRPGTSGANGFQYATGKWRQDRPISQIAPASSRGTIR